MKTEEMQQRISERIVNNALVTVDRTLITKNTDLIEDLGYDSLSIMQLIVELEIEFAIEFPDDELTIDVVSNYGKLVSVIEKLIKNSIN